ncbi:hypothetical protein QTH87_06350 [Variovorax sp. J22P168]|uniref:pilus assembly PilX family protein n=1 Tax=Variovorax jilinensis TaxID=3053513 RepID=UPI0025754D65|nr:PilX N-terminal domain-containing pilus assembly protein [Variovorax sp. J22P168]MDM0012060.1 hypothetical protein [Variovorax sp. J22P168]
MNRSDIAPMTPRRRARGFSLVVVMVAVLLCSLLTMAGLRGARLSEQSAGSDSDHQRAREAAHALLRDAEADIRGLGPDGAPCRVGCRPDGPIDIDAGQVSYPSNLAEWQDLRASLGARRPSCAAGICVPDRVSPGFWADREALDRMKKVAAAYGAHTGAYSEVDTPLLAAEPRQRAWYWVELLPYDMASAFEGGAGGAFAPDDQTPFIYRITAVAQGLRRGTQAVLQTTVVWKREPS